MVQDVQEQSVPVAKCISLCVQYAMPRGAPWRR